MQNEQDDIVAALKQPKTYGKSVDKVGMRQSNISQLFFAGHYVYKLKKAVRYAGVDFSTFEKRKLACIAEMKRSAIYAPLLIEGVKPVRRLKNGKIKIGGELGEEIDTVIIEKRLPYKSILSNMVAENKLTEKEVCLLAEQIADLHLKAKTLYSKFGTDTIQHFILHNAFVLAEFSDIFERTAVREMTEKTTKTAKGLTHLIRFRQKNGHVRKCHGALSLSNIAYFHNKFLFISPIEYNEALDSLDTLFDLAYVLMDLEAKGLNYCSCVLLNRYLSMINDINGMALLPLYKSMHAAFQAGIYAQNSILYKGLERKKHTDKARHYFALSQMYLAQATPTVTIVNNKEKDSFIQEVAERYSSPVGVILLSKESIIKQVFGEQKKPKSETHNMPKSLMYDILKEHISSAISAGANVVVEYMGQEMTKLGKEMALELGANYAVFDKNSGW